ncbi:MAG: ATPase, T2SS/T4P/T4SS family [Gammaproteobacteria bacterium]|nr:ATPase, T2SS/T4P/T4SS family [Gammaproteobacteria bacterium]
MSALDSITDIHLFSQDLGQSLLFPGPIREDNSLLPTLERLLARASSAHKKDFMLSYDGYFFRGRVESNAVDGVWYSLRRIPSHPPTLEATPTPLPHFLRAALLSPILSSGGLVYITGSPGSGKTTTASATVVSRLRTFGGFAYTVEDPPVMPLHGWHGEGFCRQTWVAGDSQADWLESMRGVLRSQPANTPVILFIGEVRDGESARAMVRAASNGFLVMATGFGTDIPSTIDALARLMGGADSDRVSLASVLRLVVHQRLKEGILSAQCLASSNGASSVAVKIRAGQIQHLVSDVQYQQNRAILGENLL